MRAINIMSPKGGQGATAFCIALATYLHSCGKRVALVGNDDIHSTAGISNDDSLLYDEDYAPTIHLPRDHMHESDYDIIVRDNCNGDNAVWIVRNDYVALRNLIRLTRRHPDPMGVVVMLDQTRVLREDDVITAAGMPFLGTITLTEGPARAIDAGLYGSVLRSRQKNVLPILNVCMSVALHNGIKGLVNLHELA